MKRIALSRREVGGGENYSLTMKSMAIVFIYFVAINHGIFSLDVLNINIIILAMSQCLIVWALTMVVYDVITTFV